MTVLRFERTAVEVEVKNVALRRMLEQGIRAALDEFATPPEYSTVRLRTFRRLAAIDVAGQIAIVRITPAGLRLLPALVEAIRAKGALGIQLVWNGEAPPRALAEPVVFRVLEAARATKSGPPVVLAASRHPVMALRVAIAVRGQT